MFGYRFFGFVFSLGALGFDMGIDFSVSVFDGMMNYWVKVGNDVLIIL